MSYRHYSYKKRRGFYNSFIIPEGPTIGEILKKDQTNPFDHDRAPLGKVT